MPNLAPLKYPKLFERGKPPQQEPIIAECTHAEIILGDRTLIQANIQLSKTTTPYTKRNALYDSVDGAGTHTDKSTAIYMAISEALERWAFRQIKTDGDYTQYGLNIDASTNGMAAYPGLFPRETRKYAHAEAIERYCLQNWWEQALDHQPLETEQTDLHGIEIENPWSEHSVVVMWKKVRDHDAYAYAFSSASTLEKAISKAEVELYRTASALHNYYKKHPHADASYIPTLQSLFERRVLYFSLPEGQQAFRNRLNQAPNKHPIRPQTVFDNAIPGPWTPYAHIWRLVYIPPSTQPLDLNNHQYFFW